MDKALSMVSKACWMQNTREYIMSKKFPVFSSAVHCASCRDQSKGQRSLEAREPTRRSKHARRSLSDRVTVTTRGLRSFNEAVAIVTLTISKTQHRRQHKWATQICKKVRKIVKLCYIYHRRYSAQAQWKSLISIPQLRTGVSTGSNQNRASKMNATR